MKVKASIKKRCNNCSLVRRGKKLYNTCIILKHKQRQG